MRNFLQNEWPQLQQIYLCKYLDSLDFNNISNQGIIVVMQRSLPLNILHVRNYLFYSGKNNITAEGLRLMPNCNFARLTSLELSKNIFT